jgi:predicted metal-binding membrane protein
MTDAQRSITVRLLGLITASWAMSILQMRGMSMGAATDLGSFPHFFPLWVTMMAAMMLPGAVAPLITHVEVRAAPPFLLSYLGLWAAAGLVAYIAYRPHGSATAGAVVLVAGCYELMPLKRRCRQRCKAGDASGIVFGLACFGSTAGLMAVLLAISPMNLSWMAGITLLALAQKMLPASWPLEIPLAVSLLAGGIWILLDPAGVPGLLASM